jgi:hypothetical protein
MPKAKHPDGTELTREAMIEALLRRIAAYTVVLKGQLKDEDFKTLRTLRPFLKAADRLLAEIGYQDEQ